MNQNMLNRRQLLELSAIGFIGLALPQETNAQPTSTTQPTSPRNVESQGEVQMPNDQEEDKRVLEQLNLRIGVEESTRNQTSYDWFADIIAPKLAFQRADPEKTIDDRVAFLEKVKPLKDGDPKPAPRETKIESIEIYGNRAVVSCIVTVKSEDGDKRFHNLRLFIRQGTQWKLLGWANEPL